MALQATNRPSRRTLSSRAPRLARSRSGRRDRLLMGGALSAQESDRAIDGAAGEALLRAVGPTDLQLVDPRRRAEAEMGSGIVAGEIAVAGDDRPHEMPRADDGRHQGPDRIAMKRGIDGAHRQPMAGGAVVVPE